MSEAARKKEAILNEAKRKKMPAVVACIAFFATTIACAILIPDGCELKNACVSISSSLFCAFMVLLVLDLRPLESRINRLDNEGAIDRYLDMLKADRSTLDHLDDEKLKQLANTTIMSLCKLSDTAMKADVNELVGLCLNEVIARVSGIYSKNVSVMRTLAPHYIEGSDEVDSWHSIQETSATLVNASREPKKIPSTTTFESGAIKNNPGYAQVRQLKYCEILYNNDLVFSGDEELFPPDCCIVDELGNRSWEFEHPSNDRVPEYLGPGDSITYRLKEEFYIPPREEVRLRWRYPRKGVSYTVRTEGIDDVIPQLSLTGCSLCDGGMRHHRCTKCDKSNGCVTIDSQSTITIMTDWAGSELGVNIEWKEKEKSQ